jgi:hypothetical protein
MIAIQGYNLDLRGLTRREGETAIRMAAASLKVESGLLFSELALSSFAYIQTRNIMGYNAILTLSIRGAFDDRGTMVAGSTLTGRMYIYTPDNTPGSMATSVVVYNNTFMDTDYAIRAFTRMEQQLEREVGLEDE